MSENAIRREYAEWRRSRPLAPVTLARSGHPERVVDRFVNFVCVSAVALGWALLTIWSVP